MGTPGRWLVGLAGVGLEAPPGTLVPGGFLGWDSEAGKVLKAPGDSGLPVFAGQLSE